MDQPRIARESFLVPHVIGAVLVAVVICVDALTTCRPKVPALRVRYFSWACAVSGMLLMVYANAEALHDEERNSTVLATGDAYRYSVWALAALAISGWGCEISCSKGNGCLLGLCCWSNCRSWTQFSAFDFYTVLFLPLTGLPVGYAVGLSLLVWLPLLVRLAFYLTRGRPAEEMECSWFAAMLAWPFRLLPRLVAWALARGGRASGYTPPGERGALRMATEADGDAGTGTGSDEIPVRHENDMSPLDAGGLHWRAAETHATRSPMIPWVEATMRFLCYLTALLVFAHASAVDWGQ